MPVQFGTYLRKGTQDEFRFIGYTQFLGDAAIDAACDDLCLMAPSVSGFELGSEKFKKTPEHTIYFTVAAKDFDDLFELVSEPRGATEVTKA